MYVAMTIHFKQVTIVGVGLIGGSLGMSLRHHGLADRVVGVGRSQESLTLAVTCGAIDAYEHDPNTAMQGADLVVLALPVDHYVASLQDWKQSLEPGTIVTDVGSVKGTVVEQMESLVPDGVHVVGAHPIAGRETSGVGAGSRDLFRGAMCLLTPTSRTDSQALRVVRELWVAVGSVVKTMDPVLHDWVVGGVSHLPHVVAFALVSALMDLQQQTKPAPGFDQGDGDLLDYAGGGLRDTTRVAASSPEMWTEICLRNRDNLLPMIDTFELHLRRFKAFIETNDGAGLEHAITLSRDARRRVR